MSKCKKARMGECRKIKLSNSLNLRQTDKFRQTESPRQNDKPTNRQTGQNNTEHLYSRKNNIDMVIKNEK